MSAIFLWLARGVFDTDVHCLVLQTLVADFDLRAGFVTVTVPNVAPANDYSIVRECWFFAHLILPAILAIFLCARLNRPAEHVLTIFAVFGDSGNDSEDFTITN